MKKYMSIYFLIAFSITSSVSAIDATDNKMINEIIEHFTIAWNYHEGHGSADYYAEDADFVNIFGMAFAGKQEIETRHVKIHEAFLKGYTFEVVNLRLREAAPDLVIAHVYWKVSNAQKPEESPMKGIFTHVILKKQDKWEIAASQNTQISN
jgi:uncharacterized protein (TIGR02246 family)